MPDDPKELLRQLFDGVSAGDFGVFDRLVADDLVEHESLPGFEQTKEGVRQLFEAWKQAFPDLRVEAHEMVAEGNMVSARITFSGTHQGDFLGLAPTGKRIEVDAIDIVRVRDGRIAEHWGVMDALTMMQQLGAIPEGPA